MQYTIEKFEGGKSFDMFILSLTIELLILPFTMSFGYTEDFILELYNLVKPKAASLH